MKKTTRFPLFVDLEDREILIVGGGNVAARRAAALLDFGARLTVCSPELSEDFLPLEQQWGAKLLLVRERFEEWWKERGEGNASFFLVLAATDDRAVNARVVQLFRERGVPVNTCDRSGDCDFYFPAIVRMEEAVLGIAGDGTDHGRIRRMAAALRELPKDFPDTGKNEEEERDSSEASEGEPGNGSCKSRERQEEWRT